MVQIPNVEMIPHSGVGHNHINVQNVHFVEIHRGVCRTSLRWMGASIDVNGVVDKIKSIKAQRARSWILPDGNKSEYVGVNQLSLKRP